MDKEKSSPLNDTALMLATALDGASERALLLDTEGNILHMNAAASNFLYTSQEQPHVLDFLTTAPSQKDWKSVTKSRVIMKQTQAATRSERNVKIMPLPASSYYCMYVCSKHERLQQVVDTAFEAVLTADADLCITAVNQATLDLFVYNNEADLIGLNVLEFLCGDDTEMTINDMLNTTRHELVGTKSDGTTFPMQVNVQEIKGYLETGYCAFVKDLTIVKQHETELQERQALVQGMIDASFDSMLQIDEHGMIQIVNDAACSMFGYTREEFIGSNISIICGDGHGSKHDSYMQRYLQTGQRHIIGRKRQVMARRKDNSEFHVELGVQEVVLGNGKRAFCGYMRDLTQQKKDKRALQKQARMIHGKFFGGAGEENTGDGDGDGVEKDSTGKEQG